MWNKTLKSFWLRLNTFLRLGLKNIFFVFIYRIKKKMGYYEKTMPIGTPYTLFLESWPETVIPNLSEQTQKVILNSANRQIKGQVCYFSHAWFDIGSPPDWFKNPFQNKRCQNYKKHWSKLADFSDEIGDIKVIWETSRLAWAINFAKAYKLTLHDQYLNALNNWLSDWTEKNPANAGPNWKCGQEAGIRMINLLLAARILGQAPHNLNESLINFIWEHCKRIEHTLLYGVAQNNNHGMSEASALFIGGACLNQQSIQSSIVTKATYWENLGRKWIENRVQTLIEPDGSFSQYSVNYHRMMLDILNYTEIWRKILKRKPFSKIFYKKAQKATNWLFIFTNELNGQAPNIGANDGTHLFNITNASYLDYRPTVDLAGRLFLGKSLYSNKDNDQILDWLNVDIPPRSNLIHKVKKKPTLFKEGGYCFINQGEVEIFIRFPSFKFRPSHCDLLHIDLWFQGKNIICDSGTYSYNCKEPYITYFPGTIAHSTIQMDDQDQMRRIGRFLFASWPKNLFTTSISIYNGKISWQAGYRDYKGAEHIRKVILTSNKVTVIDKISRFKKRGILRWHLIPIDWKLEGTTCNSSVANISIKSYAPIKNIHLTHGYRSLYYLKKEKTPLLEVEVNEPTQFTTEIKLTS